MDPRSKYHQMGDEIAAEQEAAREAGSEVYEDRARLAGAQHKTYGRLFDLPGAEIMEMIGMGADPEMAAHLDSLSPEERKAAIIGVINSDGMGSLDNPATQEHGKKMMEEHPNNLMYTPELRGNKAGSRAGNR